MSVSVKLSKPIMMGDQEIHVLDLRMPTIDEMLDIGEPSRLVMDIDSKAIDNAKDGGGKGYVETDNKIVMRYISVLSATPPSSLKELTIADFKKLRKVVVDFLGSVEEA